MWPRRLLTTFPLPQRLWRFKLKRALSERAPGSSSECDWSNSASESVECVQALPARGISTAAHSSDVKMDPVEEADPTGDVNMEDVKEESATESRPTDGSAAANDAAAPSSKHGLDTSFSKEPVDDPAPRPRRRKITLGSAHLHILRAVADADAANWESLQAAISEAEGSGRVKSELVGRLTQIADKSC